MDKAKETVKKFMSNDGKHDTTVHEKVNPAVQQETITRQQHERQTTAVDREVHQDHYHTTEQPVQHSEVLPEKHHHNAAPVEKRTFEHRDADKDQSRLQDEHSKYYDTQQRVEGERTHEHAGTVQGEHVHHHVHETIQPVVNKQTIEPHVIHTTVPIHEVHHNEAHHHASTALPPMSMEEFKNSGGALGGREERLTRHEKGEPQSIGGHSVRNDHGPVAGTTDHSGRDQRTTHATTERIGHDARTNPSSGLDGGYGSTGDRLGSDSRTNQSSGLPIADQFGSSTGNTGESLKNDGHTFGTMDGGVRNTDPSYGNTSGTHKPSLLDKLNPKKDADGDGKAGFMK